MVEMFYRLVKQAVLLFGLETWVLSEVMDRTVGGTYTGFMRYITGNQVRRKVYGIWVTPRAAVVW